jgi:hypothetical protein
MPAGNARGHRKDINKFRPQSRMNHPVGQRYARQTLPALEKHFERASRTLLRMAHGQALCLPVERGGHEGLPRHHNVSRSAPQDAAPPFRGPCRRGRRD